MNLLLRVLWILVLPGAVLAAEPRPATEAELALFKEAMKNTTQDTEHWAYTETTRATGRRGRGRQDTVVRFDPSLPYAEQYTPLKIEGAPPSEKQIKEYRERGEKRGKKLADGSPGQRPAVNLGGRKMPLDIEHPQVAAETATECVFAIPLADAAEIPADKVRIQARVNKTTRQLVQARFTILESFRMKLVAKVKAGEVVLDFTVVDPKFGPVITAVSGDYALSVFFMSVGGTFSTTRTEWQRVKPYNERLQVRMGPLQFLD